MKSKDLKSPRNCKANNFLGKKWAEKSGDNYKYFMVFESKNVDRCYSSKNVLDIISDL